MVIEVKEWFPWGRHGVRGGSELTGKEHEGNFQGLANVLNLVLLVVI